MDNRKKDVIERFVQAASFHGPKLVNLTQEEQGDGIDSVMGFVSPYCKDITAASYFRNRLQTSCPREGADDHSANNTASWSDDYTTSQQMQPETARNAVSRTSQFEQRLCKFIATKADLLFEMQGKTQLRQGMDCGTHQEGLQLYANPPPLETLMAVPIPGRRKELFKVLKAGSIVLGDVISKRPFGIFVKLVTLEFSKTRDFTGLNVQALCRTTDLGGSAVAREYKDPTDAFVVGDRVRGVISDLNAEEERVSLSFRISRLPPEYESLQLGVIDETPDNGAKRITHYEEDKSYDDHLKADVGFNNPRSVETLIDDLGIDEKAPCSLLRTFHRCSYPEGDFAEALRKKQSAKWSMETTAKGVEHFKAGSRDTAAKYFEHALQIDSENVEALVARGALSANQAHLSAAVKDFKRALSISATHRNAHKYLTATLMEQGIQLEKEGELVEALQCFKETLGFDRGQATAREHLEKVQQQIVERNQKKEKDDAAKKEEDNKSKFRHVRQLIEEEQSQAKRKKMAARKKKKKQSQRKKRRMKSKSRRRSKRSSSSDESSDDDTSSSSAGEAWVEKSCAGRKSRRSAEAGTRRGTDQRGTSESSRRSWPLQGEAVDRTSGKQVMSRHSSSVFPHSSSDVRHSARPIEQRTARKRKTRSPSSESSSSTTNVHGHSCKYGRDSLAKKTRKERLRSRSSDSSSSSHGDKRERSCDSSPDRRYSTSKPDGKEQ